MNEREIEKILKALANQRHLKILKYLKKNKEGSVGKIADSIKLSFKATSKHLAVLSSADIVEREQRSLQMFYSINKSASEPAKVIVHLL